MTGGTSGTEASNSGGSWDFETPPLVPLYPARQAAESQRTVHVTVQPGMQAPTQLNNEFGVVVRLPGAIAENPTAAAAAIRATLDALQGNAGNSSGHQYYPVTDSSYDTSSPPAIEGGPVQLIDDAGPETDPWSTVTGGVVPARTTSRATSAPARPAAAEQEAKPSKSGRVKIAGLLLALTVVPGSFAFGHTYTSTRQDATIQTMHEDVAAIPVLGGVLEKLVPWPLLERLP